MIQIIGAAFRPQLGRKHMVTQVAEFYEYSVPITYMVSAVVYPEDNIIFL